MSFATLPGSITIGAGLAVSTGDALLVSTESNYLDTATQPGMVAGTYGGVTFNTKGVATGVNNAQVPSPGLVGITSSTVTAYGFGAAVGSGANNTSIGVGAGTAANTNQGCTFVGFNVGHAIDGSGSGAIWSTVVGAQSMQTATKMTGITSFGQNNQLATPWTQNYPIVVGVNNSLAADYQIVVGTACVAAAGHSNAVLIGNNVSSVAANCLHLGSATGAMSVAASATTGANGILPAQVQNYMIWYLNGNLIKIPYYNN